MCVNTRFYKRFSSPALTAAVQAGSGEIPVGLISVSNPDTVNAAWLQLFDKDSVPTLGTDIAHQIIIPAGKTVFMSSGASNKALFESFRTGFGVGASTTVSGATAVTAGLVILIEYGD